MEAGIKDILVNSLYLLALINPISKVAVLSGASDREEEPLLPVAVRSTIVAGLIILTLSVAGDFVLRDIFRVKLYSLAVSGGVILFWVGFNALTKGMFFEIEVKKHFEDASIVPLACPLIAGPATIAACIALTAHQGFLRTLPSVLIAIAINMGIMAASRQIARVLKRYNVLGALIRITGLVVATMGVQMVFDGVAAWMAGRG